MNGEIFYQRYLTRIRWFLLISTVLISVLFLVLQSDSAKVLFNVAGVSDNILKEGRLDESAKLERNLIEALKEHTERQLVKIGLLEDGKGLEGDWGAAGGNPGSAALSQLQSKLQFQPTNPTLSELFVVGYYDVELWISKIQKFRLSVLRGEASDGWETKNFKVADLTSLEAHLQKIYDYDISLQKVFDQRGNAVAFIAIVICWLGGIFAVCGLQLWCLRGPAQRYMLNGTDPTSDELKKLQRIEAFFPWVAVTLVIALGTSLFMGGYSRISSYNFLVGSMYVPFLLVFACWIALYLEDFINSIISLFNRENNRVHKE